MILPGETSSGKSTLLNLILGERLLPCTHLSTTSTICELKYGPTPKLVAHFKGKDPETGETEKTVWLGQQSYLDEISSFVHVKVNRKKGSDFKKIELFWPHSLLQVGNESKLTTLEWEILVLFWCKYKGYCFLREVANAVQLRHLPWQN